MEEKFERLPPEVLPDWLIESRKSQLEQTELLGGEAVAQSLKEVPGWILDQDLPNTKQGIEARNKQDRTVWLTRCISQKLYNCPCCTSNIQLGEEHVLLRIQQSTKYFDHHHYHKPCSLTVIDFERPVQAFKYNKEKDRQISKRQARTRSRSKRRG